jgi:hypothetical protein
MGKYQNVSGFFVARASYTIGSYYGRFFSKGSRYLLSQSLCHILQYPGRYKYSAVGLACMTSNDDIRVKASMAVDDARVAVHGAIDDAKTAVHNVTTKPSTVQNVVDDAKIQAHKISSDAKIKVHQMEEEVKKKKSC